MTLQTATESGRAAPSRPTDSDHSFRGTLGKILLVFGGNAAGMLLGLVANVWAMRSLGPESYAVVAVALVILFVIWQITGKGLDQTAVRLAAITDHPQGPAAIFETVYALKLVANVVLLGASLALAGPLTTALMPAGTSTAPVYLAFLGASAASLWGFNSAAIQAESQFVRYTPVQVANNFVKLAVIAAIALTAGLTPVGVMTASVVGFSAAAVVGAVLAPRYARRPRFHADVVPHILRYARWLVLSSVLFLLYSRIDILMLSRMTDAKTVGLYSAAALLAQMADLLAASILTVFLPRFARHTETDPLREQVKSSLRCSVLLVLPLIPCFFLIEPVMLALFRESYAGAAPFLKIMFFGVLFTMLTHPLHILFYARGRPHILTALDAFMLVLMATGHFFAISRYGPYGAAVVVLISRFVAGSLLSVGIVYELKDSGAAPSG